MSVWQVQVCKIAIQSGTSRLHFPEKIDEIFKDLPNVFGTADDILILGYNADSRDHDRTSKMSNADM